MPSYRRWTRGTSLYVSSHALHYNPQIGTACFDNFRSAFRRRVSCLPSFLLADTAVIAMRCRSGAFSRSGEEGTLDTTDQDEDMEFDVRWGACYNSSSKQM